MLSIMKVLASLFRLLCSLLLLVAAALYVNCPGNPDINTYAAQLTGENILAIFTSLNWASITAAALVLAALLRLLDIAWNMGFCLSILLVLNAALYFFFGAESLPEAIRHNLTVVDFCGLVQSYPVPALIAAAVFALGWLAASAAFRVAFNTLLCYGLWYICAVIFHEMVTMYAAKPLLPGNATADSIVTFLLEYPWVCAALPGTFFLVYALLLSFFDSFPATVEKKQEESAEAPTEETKQETPADSGQKKNAEPAKEAPKPAAAPRPATAAAAVAKPTPTRPLLTPRPVLKKTAAPAAATPPAKEPAPAAPKTAASPEEPAKAGEPASTPKAEETPAAPAAEKADAPAEQPAAEEKTAAAVESPAPSEAPKAEEPRPEKSKEEAPPATPAE